MKSFLCCFFGAVVATGALIAADSAALSRSGAAIGGEARNAVVASVAPANAAEPQRRVRIVYPQR